MNTNKPSAFLIELLTAAHVSGTPYITFRDFLCALFEKIKRNPAYAARLRIRECIGLIPQVFPPSSYEETLEDQPEVGKFKIDTALRELLDNAHSAACIITSAKEDDLEGEYIPFPGLCVFIKGLCWMNGMSYNMVQVLNFPFDSAKYIFWGTCPEPQRKRLFNEEVCRGEDDKFIKLLNNSDWISLLHYCALRQIDPPTRDRVMNVLTEQEGQDMVKEEINHPCPLHARAFIQLFSISDEDVLKYLLP